jgi:6-pyruvoyl-tetrahydropterin synthase
MEVIIEASEVDLNGMVMDFKKLNEILQPIMVKFDHKIVLEGKQETFTGRETILTCNPTAENMAKWIWNAICHEVRFESPTATKLIIRLHETATGWAEYEQELK